ncbi:MAG: N-acetylmuramoyl-L-alanine amidase [Clostridia bacterium]|nr:N-acetylmuramoyl-L-alanine amidase [Clostridia bacterium]
MFYSKRRYGAAILFGLIIAATALALWSGEDEQTEVTAPGEKRVSVVVLDAGHGGADGGTVGRAGTVEKDLNLEIVLLAREFCDILGVETVLTRAEDVSLGQGETLRSQKVNDLKARAELVGSIGSAAFISIHQNYYDDFVSRGAQVFYSPGNPWGEALAVKMQGRLKEYCDTNNKRQAMPIPNRNYLLENLACPAIIIECGFLSHLEEEMLLNSPEYMEKLAFCIAAQALDCVSAGIEPVIK